MNHIVIIVGQLRLGGAERVAALWARGFINRGYKVSVVTNVSKQIDYDIPSQVNLCHFDFSPKNLKKRFIQCVFELRKLIKELNPDVLITVLYPLNIFALLSSLGMNIPIVNTEHNSFERPEGSRLPFIAKFSKFFVNKFFSHVTVLTEADKKIIGNKLRHISVLPNPLAFSPAKAIPHKEKWIVASGRLDVWYCKGFDLLIKAWAKLAPVYPDWNLKICGCGSNNSLKYLENLAQQYKILDRIEFLGFRKDVQMIYNHASIFILSSRYEGFGMVLIEAMSQGCACVACDFNGRQGEILQNDSQGILCRIDDVESLTIAMKKMLDDEPYRCECQMNAIERSKCYELDKVMNCWESILRNLVRK